MYNLNRTRLFSPSSPGESYLFCVDVKEGSSLRWILDLAVVTHHVDAGCVVDSIHASAAVEVIRYPIVCLLGRAPAHEELAKWCEEQGGWELAVVERDKEAPGLRGSAEAVDRGADIRVVAQRSTPRQGLRAEGPDQRDAHRGGDDPAPAQAASESGVNLAKKHALRLVCPPYTSDRLSSCLLARAEETLRGKRLTQEDQG